MGQLRIYQTENTSKLSGKILRFTFEFFLKIEHSIRIFFLRPQVTKWQNKRYFEQEEQTNLSEKWRNSRTKIGDFSSHGLYDLREIKPWMTGYVLISCGSSLGCAVPIWLCFWCWKSSFCMRRLFYNVNRLWNLLIHHGEDVCRLACTNIYSENLFGFKFVLAQIDSVCSSIY